MVSDKLFVLFITVHMMAVSGDVYLHNPRGSNNRLFENSRNRNNANRMFDSQNNDRGGYNAGSLYYYVRSKLPIEWTNQHSCGDENSNCEIILQYMCSDLLRDGTTQTTIPENPNQCKDGNCDKDLRYGMHEDYYYYANCKLRTRNQGLFTANRNLKGQSAKYTRQNNQGTRRGYECPEERDYYPYWHPTPWKDIAVFTNDVSRCAYYQSESQNVKPRYYCDVPYQHLWKNAKDSYVHFQWTGSNDNPNNNDGQGRQGTDRSNVVPMGLRPYQEGDPNKAATYTNGHAGVAYPRNVLEAEFLGFSDETKMKLASLYNVQFGGDMEELDDAGTYYDIGPQRVTMSGDYNYMCTRNNNFSNRSQKGKIVVREGQVAHQYMGELGGNLTVTGSESSSQTSVSVPPSSLSSAQFVSIEVIPEHELTLSSRPPNTDYVSHFVHLSNDLQVDSSNPLAMTIELKNGVAVGSLYRPTVFRTRDDSSWISVTVDEADSSAVKFRTDAGGHFVVVSEVDPGPMAGLVIGLVLAVVMIGVAVYYCRNSKLPLAGYSSKV